LNALGLFAVLGLLLALGLAAHSRSPAMGAMAAASSPVLVLTLYFTYSRGAWMALAVGLPATLAADPRRLRALVTALALAPAIGVAMVVAYQSEALNRSGAQLADASRQGHRVAAVLGAAAVLNSLVALSLRRLEGTLVVRRSIRRAFLAAMVVLTVALVLVAMMRAGGPVTVVSRVWEGFSEPIPEVGDRASDRLFSVSGSNRLAQWRVAWRAFEREPVVGLGAGTYEESWYELRSDAYKVRDAHSLYFESLAELGAVGTALLLMVLGIPLLTVGRLGRAPVAPAAFGAYVAFLVHAGVDWDWEMPAVTLVAVICAGVVLVAARGCSTLSVPRPAVVVALVACLGVAVFSTVGLIGNRALDDADSALRAGDVERAVERAHRGLRWAPWSAQGHRILAESRLLEGDLAGAHASMRQAVAADPRDWELWFALAQIASGGESARALAEARRLNPLSPEIRAYVRSLERSE
jgi:O-antigen ligase